MKTKCPKCKKTAFIFNMPMSYPYSQELKKVRYVCEECGYYEWKNTGLFEKNTFKLNNGSVTVEN